MFLVGQVADVPALEPGPERRVEGGPDVLGDGEAERDDPEVLAHPDQLPPVQLLLRVTLPQELVVPGDRKFDA